MSNTKHTTHFDDCGCKSAEYEKQIAALKAEVERLRGREQAASALLSEAKGRFTAYQMDCDADAPLLHRQFMKSIDEWQRAIQEATNDGR